MSIPLESFHLRFDEAAHVVFPRLTPALNGVHALAAAVEGCARVGTVVAGADAPAVEG